MNDHPELEMTMIATTTRPEVSINDLAAVMAAAKLLRQYDLISVAKIRDIRTKVHEDCNVNMERYSGDFHIQTAVNEVWKQTRPL